MEINLPQYLSNSERLEYIKILQKICMQLGKTSGVWINGYITALQHIEMFLSGNIKKVIWK